MTELPGSGCRDSRSRPMDTDPSAPSMTRPVRLVRAGTVEC
ncbi:hypothetical protein ACGFJC_06530 [Nonomuraea fuscirosea]|nr:hypothetical protein [Nonomuraea fuscirosea]WSA57367.1 hypothetical protein OIE67_22955 [Nonomuraea fuscirosea]